MLESLSCEDNAFVTLTYDNDHLPEGGTLKPQDLKNWQKNLRYHSGINLRFFSVGEYGDQTKRPHYHAAVFGFKGCASLDLKCPCVFCETLRSSWKKGHVLNGTLTKDSASYIAGYVTKKMTDRNPQEKYDRLLEKGEYMAADQYKERVIDELDGRHPEFARMSLKPGIGAPMIPAIREMLWDEHGNELMGELGDVPDMIKISGQEVLLGGYLKNKLRREFLNEDEIQEVKERKMLQLQKENLQAYWEEKAKRPKKIGRKFTFKDFIIDKHLQKVRDLEKRYSRKPNKGEL